ncbi:MAG: DNA polymerase/3'-5' exonuclease PolX [Bacteroidia bacterium]
MKNKAVQHNRELAEIFSKMADIYRYMGTAERFRALAYKKAAQVIAGLPRDIEEYCKEGTLDEISGIGEHTAERITEFLKTKRISTFEELKRKVPFELLELMEVSGIGPQTLKKIHEELGIQTKEEFIKALENGTIAQLKGFGAKKTENIRRGLKLHKTIEERMLLSDALETGGLILSDIKKIKGVHQAELAGSLRRMKETIGDIDILVSADSKARMQIIKAFTSSALSSKTLAAGDTKASIILKNSGRQADLRIVADDEWGAALLYFTGSKEHNVHLRTIAAKKGFKISEYGLFSSKSNRRIAAEKEEDIYSGLGFQFIPPELREDKGELELAFKKQLPELVTLSDIRGDLQMHSTYSDGSQSIAEIAAYVRKHFSYEYIVITDHSQSSAFVNGLDEKRLLKQMKEIDRLNEKAGDTFIKKGIEVDILPDGSLDIDDEILAQLDWVTAAIHSNFKHDNTERILRACENPYVKCIGHPTGRLIGSRAPYALDFETVVKQALHTNTALEINAQPERLDLNDEMAKYAREKGVKLVISTDAHHLSQYDYMKLGVAVARRAWCTKEHILNTKSWKEIIRTTQKKIK